MIEDGTKFELTSDHLKLLQALSPQIDEPGEYSAPTINQKRPFGNSNIHADIALILDWRPNANVASGWTIDQHNQAEKLLGELTFALSIVLNRLEFKPGLYIYNYNREEWIDAYNIDRPGIYS